MINILHPKGDENNYKMEMSTAVERLKQSDIILLQEERVKMNEELQARELQFQSEKEQKENLQKLISEYEKRVFKGGQGDDENKKKYTDLRKKLKQQKKLQDKLLEEKKQKEEELLTVEKNYQNLQEEVEELRKKMKIIKGKYKSSLNEIKDLQTEHETNREDFLDTIRSYERDMKLHQSIIKMMLSDEEIEKLKIASEFQEEKNEYKIPIFTFKEMQLKFPKLPEVQGLFIKIFLFLFIFF